MKTSSASRIRGTYASRYRTVMALLGMGVLGGCATGYGGAARNGTYTAPTGQFSIPIPRTIFGTRTEDGRNENGSWVRFTSDDGATWQIETYSLPADKGEMMADSARNDQFTSGFFHDVIVRDYQDRHPGSKVLSSSFVADSVGRAYFGVLRLPGASAAVQMVQGEMKRLDAIMHLLLFQRGEWFYVLKLVPGELSGEDTDNPDVSPDWALSFRRRIEFHPPQG